jgi:hypothetical protein
MVEKLESQKRPHALRERLLIVRHAGGTSGSDFTCRFSHRPILRYLLLAGKYAVTVDILASAGKLEYGPPNHADHVLNKNPISANFDFSSVYVARVSWFFLFLLVGVVYWPGLSGPFVLDDFGSIKALGDRGGVVDWETFKAFVLGGNSGPTGRPVS